MCLGRRELSEAKRVRCVLKDCYYIFQKYENIAMHLLQRNAKISWFGCDINDPICCGRELVHVEWKANKFH